MSESKILQSLLEFKTKYAWDKSLITSNEASTSRPPLIPNNSEIRIQSYEEALAEFTGAKNE